MDGWIRVWKCGTQRREGVNCGSCRGDDMVVVGRDGRGGFSREK